LPSLSLGAQADTWPEDGHPAENPRIRQPFLNQWRQRCATGDVIVVRYADDKSGA
jgi:hypothetical protein